MDFKLDRKKRKKLENVIEQEFRTISKYVGSKVSSFFDKDDYRGQIFSSHITGQVAERRKKALFAVFPRLEKEFSSLKLDLVYEFVHNELYPYNDYCLFDVFSQVRIGASLWYLETLQRAGKLDELYSLLPKLDFNNGFVCLPRNFYYPCFPNWLIETVAVMFTLRFIGYSDGKPVISSDRFISDNNHFFSVVSEWNASGKEQNSLFRDMLSLLPEDDVKKACGCFRDKVWDLLGRYLRGFDLVSALWYDRCKDVDSRNVVSDVENLFTSRVCPVGPVASYSVPVFNQQVCPSDSYFPLVKSGFRMVTADGVLLDNGSFDFYSHRDRLYDVFKHFTVRFDEFLSAGYEEMLEKCGNKELAGIVSGFSVGDPLPYCFAAIYLLDSGDDLAWLFHSGGSLMKFVYNRLPWAMVSGIDNDKPEVFVNKNTLDLSGYPSGFSGSFIGSDYYRPCLGKLTPGQIVYQASGCVVPYGYSLFGDMRKKLADKGLLSSDADRYMDLASVLYLSRVNAEVFDFDDVVPDDSADEDRESLDEEGSVSSCSSVQQSVETSQLVIRLKNELASARNKVKSLKAELAVSRQEFQEKEDRAAAEISLLRREHTELVDLRELVFNRNSLDDTAVIEPSVDDKDSLFPYSTVKRTVVFGGHDTFLKVMKPMFPSVRFVDTRNVSFNPDIVRNSDIVWIQNNCISHSQFWSVIKYAGLYGVQVRYFASAGTERCAKQLVDGDREVSA